MSAKSGDPDYRSMDGPTLLAALSDDATKWAAAFIQIWPRGHHWEHDGAIDEGTMIGWFANAIEHSHDIRIRRMQPPTRPIIGKSGPADRTEGAS